MAGIKKGCLPKYREVNIDLEPLGSSGCSKKFIRLTAVAVMLTKPLRTPGDCY